MTTVTGTVLYVGYVKSCTVFLDFDDDGTQDDFEPSTETDDFGGYSFTFEASMADTAYIVVKAGSSCVDRYTNEALSVSLSAPPSCQYVSLLSSLKKEIVADKVAAGAVSTHKV